MAVTENRQEASQWHLTSSQIRDFDSNGYLILRNRIPHDLLARMRDASAQWIKRSCAIRQEDPAYQTDFLFSQDENGAKCFRVNYIHNLGDAVTLEMLGSPQVCSIAESLCGENFVPTYESMVFKMQGDGAPIAWHQDAIHSRKFRVFNLDIYLDDSGEKNGALRVIPGTQHHPYDIRGIKNWRPDGVITVEMSPGDVLLHDVMLVHGSPGTPGGHLRRTIYYEFRAADMIVHEGPWDRTWIGKRMQLIPLALQKFHEAYPAHAMFQWHVADRFRPARAHGEKVALKILHH